jgi:hypothetical protein
MSQLAEGAVKQGFPPMVKLQNGMAHLFGARTVERMPYKSYNADETGIAVNVYERRTDPFGYMQRQSTGNEIYMTELHEVDNPAWLIEEEARKNPDYRKKRYDAQGKRWSEVKKTVPEGAHLKAATQAAVLVTHNMDAINMALAFDRMIKSKAGTLGAAQVFDGAFMVPKEARAYAKALNDTFYEINSEYSYLEDFMLSLKQLKKADGTEFNFTHIHNWLALKRRIDQLVSARSKMIKAFKHGSKYIYQFYWDGADIAKAKSDNISIFEEDTFLIGN